MIFRFFDFANSIYKICPDTNTDKVFSEKPEKLQYE